jgi:hypothetical protein
MRLFRPFMSGSKLERGRLKLTGQAVWTIRDGFVHFAHLVAVSYPLASSLDVSFVPIEVTPLSFQPIRIIAVYWWNEASAKTECVLKSFCND